MRDCENVPVDETHKCANCEERVKPITMHNSPTMHQIKCPLCGEVDHIPKR